MYHALYDSVHGSVSDTSSDSFHSRYPVPTHYPSNMIPGYTRRLKCAGSGKQSFNLVYKVYSFVPKNRAIECLKWESVEITLHTMLATVLLLTFGLRWQYSYVSLQQTFMVYHASADEQIKPQNEPYFTFSRDLNSPGLENTPASAKWRHSAWGNVFASSFKIFTARWISPSCTSVFPCTLREKQ